MAKILDQEKQEAPKEIVETTTKCASCGKTLYQNEICSCQKMETPKWMGK